MKKKKKKRKYFLNFTFFYIETDTIQYVGESVQKAVFNGSTRIVRKNPRTQSDTVRIK